MNQRWHTREIAPVRSRLLWLWLPLAVGLLAAIASLCVPMTWRDYFRYVVDRFSWPLVAALLTATFVTIAVLFSTKRWRTSGIVAASMFISVVLHMLTVSIFDLLVINNKIAPFVVREKRRELSFSLPSLSESTVSQAVRARFSETAMADSRRFETGKNSRPELAEKPITKPQPKLSPTDRPDPAREKATATFASKPEASAKEVLTTLPAKTPDINQAKIAMLKPAPSAREQADTPRPATREIKLVPVPQAHPDLLAEPPDAAPSTKLKDAQRDPLRGQIDIEPRRPREPRIDENMRATTLAATRDELKLPAAKTPAGANAAQPAPSLAPKREFSVSHEAASSIEIPTPEPASRKLITSLPKVNVTSLAKVDTARTERQPAVNVQSLSAGTDRPRSLEEPVRLQDTVAGMTEKRNVDPDRTPVQSARETLHAGRTAGTPAEAETTLPQPRAQLNLKARTSGDKTLVTSRPGTAGPVRVDRPGVREQLAKAEDREAISQPVLGVGRNTEAPQSASADTGPGGTAPRPGSRKEQAPSRAKTGIADGTIGSGRRSSLPAANLTVHPSSDSVVYGLPDVLSARPQASTPTAEEKLSLPMGSLPSSQLNIVVGGSAESALDNAAGSVGGPITTPAGRHDLATAKSQGEPSPGEIRPALTERPLGETSGSMSHHSLADSSLGILSSREALPTSAAQETLPAGSATEMERSVAALMKLVPDMAQAAQDDRLGKVAAESGETQRDPGQAGMRIAKATGMLQSGMETLGPRASAQTSGRAAEAGVLGDPALYAVAPSMESRTPGVSQNTLTAFPITPAARLDSVALGIAGREAAAKSDSAPATSSFSSGPSALSEVRVTRAGREALPDTAPAGEEPVFETSGLSLSASRPPARMELEFAGSPAAQAEVHTEISTGNMPGEAVRTLISAELSAVPGSVPEKAIYRLRVPERRKEFIEELGGSDKTEEAMERALVWLAKAQSDDGRWDVDGFKTLSKCGGPGDRKDGDVALTGLCLLSYLGAGYTHVTGDHKETVRKALNWLAIGQKADGDLQRDGQMYGQAMATAALCECYSMTGDQRLRDPVERAVGFILKAQNPGAGWRYLPRQDNDTSVTGWQVLALKSAMIAGIPFPPEHFQWVEAWLDKVRRGPEGGLYTYMPGHGATPTMTAEGWFCQLMMREQTRMRGQAETIPFLMAHPPVWSPKERTINLYFWYYATLALHMSGAAEFKQWNQALTQALLTGQVQSGPASGSWDPVCVLGDRGGRVYSTATAALCLEVYYRYLPFYKQK